jgi:hypothetical protein
LMRDRSRARKAWSSSGMRELGAKRGIVWRLNLGVGWPVGYREHPIGQRILPDVRALVWILQ